MVLLEMTTKYMGTNAAWRLAESKYQSRMGNVQFNQVIQSDSCMQNRPTVCALWSSGITSTLSELQKIFGGEYRQNQWEFSGNS